MTRKIRYISIVIWLTCALSYGSGTQKPKYGPAGHPLAIPLSESNEYFRNPKHPAPDFWALISFYVPQYNDSSCGAASLTIVLNAARAHFSKTADEAVITQQKLIERISSVEHFKERMTTGYQGHHGVPLDELGKITEAGFKIYGFPKSSVEVVHIQDSSDQTQNAVAKMLSSKKQTDFLIANINQKNFTDDADVGHHAVVGAYDADHQKILILDPDREYYEPYWVSLSTFVKAMATQDSTAGMKHRGYILIHTK